MIYFTSILLLIIGIVFLFFQHPKFGKAPSGIRLKTIEKSENYKNGSFQNLSVTPFLAEGHSPYKVYYNFLFKSYENTIPKKTIPSIKTDIKKLNINENLLIWFGHSSYYFQLNGKRFLVDPVFSGNVSPIPNTAKSFDGSDIYTVEDLPEIDYLLITHDHYDHLDYDTILKLKNKVANIICPLGVGSHFEYWEYDPNVVIEKDWYDSIELGNDIRVDLTPSRHFSGRTFKRNNTLWTSYCITAPNYKMYLGGDSGYDTHFKKIGDIYGPFDIALLENGQYNEAWHNIHTFPEELLLASEELKAKRVVPVHSGKFKLAHHTWDAPLKDLIKLNNGKQNIATPKIGEIIYLNKPEQKFTNWWEQNND